MSSAPDFRLDGTTALITGGGTGIGRAMAKAFADSGATVIIAGRRREPLEETAAGRPNRIIPRPYDVTEVKKASQFVEEIQVEFGPLGILINNAGIPLIKPAEEVTIDDFQAVFNTHILGSHALSTAVMPQMKERGQGVILYTASMASFIGIPQVVAYSAAKSAMLGIIRTMAVEWGRYGIRVNAIAPGWIDSAMMRKAMETVKDRSRRVLERTALGKFGAAQDIAAAAVYLCSPAADFITGVCLPVDGGAAIGL